MIKPFATMGQRIKACRLEKDMTQADLGARLGISKGAVSQWENDETTPQMDTLKRLGHIFGQSVEWLMSGNGKTHAAESEEEVELCRIFRAMPPEQKSAYLLIGRGLAK